MREGGGGDMMTQASKKATKEKSHFVGSISFIVLYNNKVNHALCSAVGYMLFIFCVNTCI